MLEKDDLHAIAQLPGEALTDKLSPIIQEIREVNVKATRNGIIIENDIQKKIQLI